jgi:hypothetical protein
VRIIRVFCALSLLGVLLILTVPSRAAQARATTGLEFSAYVRPSQGQPEPVRGMTFYLLSRSLSDIRKEVESAGSPVDIDHFIAQLSVSPQLKEWMKTHHRVDLAGTDFIKELTADDILDVPEFLKAYKDQNGAALHAGVPEPNYKAGDERKNPEKYKRDVEQYRQALRHYIQANLDSLQGFDAELRDINPQLPWMRVKSEDRRRVEQRVMQLAQTRYLAATTTTDLDGRAAFGNLAPGEYWISNLDAAALAGDLRLHWDVAVTLTPTKPAHIELSNLNAVETSELNAN